MTTVSGLASTIEKLCRSDLPHDILLDKVLSVLSDAIEAKATLIFSFSKELRRFNFLGGYGAPPRKLEKLRSLISPLLEADVRRKTARVLKKNKFTFMESTPCGSMPSVRYALLIRYFFERQKITDAVVFVSSRAIEKKRIAMLESFAGHLYLLIENKTYREKATAFASVANFDGLTGLHNHRYFQECFSNELMRAQRFNHPVSLLMLDVDHFKEYNDRYGHPKGDIVLKEIARILRKTIRGYDIPARYGGEEMAVILPHTTQDQALIVAERIREKVNTFTFPGTGNDERVNVTVSIGVSTFPLNGNSRTDVINRADQALYLAKSEGRNRVCLSLVASKDLVTIGFCPAAFTSAYYHDILTGALDMKKEIPNIDLLVRAPQYESDYGMLTKIIDEFVEKKVDAVALCTQSKTAAAEIAKLNNAGIPVFMFNVPKKIKGVKIESYVGYDQKEAGRIVGGYIARILRGKGNIALIKGLDEPTSVLRVSGLNEIISSIPSMKIVAGEKADWLKEKAEQVTKKILSERPDVDAFFAVSDEMALGAAEAVASSKKLGEIFIVGLDGTLDALYSISKGKLTATLNTNPREMGRILVRTIVRSLIREETIQQEIFSPINMVGLENVNHSL